jgi:YegS/Rv2252/BmrU family lipid kinase
VPEFSAVAADPPFQSALLVVNPISGRGAGLRAARDLARGLREHGVEVEVHETTGRGSARAHLASLAYRPEVVVAAGGDGTLRETLEGLPDPELPVGILPSGTANVLAKVLGVPRDPAANLAVLLRGRTLAIDVTRSNGQLSFLMTSAGLDARVVQELEARRRGPITKWSYVAAGLRALRGYRAPRLTLEVDGRAVEGEYGLVIVGNAPLYAGFVRLARVARMDDGRLEVYAFRGRRPLGLTLALARGIAGEVRGGPVRQLQGRTVRIASSEPVPFQHDGDFGGTTPVTVELLPARHRLVVP